MQSESLARNSLASTRLYVILVNDLSHFFSFRNPELCIMPTTVLEKNTKCYHCGDDCQNSIVQSDEKCFCCEGCKTVYELLSENGMCTYYDFEKNPGIKIKVKSQERFAFLDNEEIANKLSDFNEGNDVLIHFYIPKIHCASCIWLLENLYRLKDGIITSRVDFIKRELCLSFKKDIVSLRTIVELLDSFGYTPEINLENYDQQETKKTDRSIYYKIGLAAFCSGNIMLLSFPDYFGMKGITDNSFQSLFRFINLMLSLPVIFYSAQDFFISAYGGLKHKQLNLDVPISLGISAIFLRSIYEVILNIGPGYFDSLTGLIFFMLIGKWYQRKTYNSFSFERDYKSYFPVSTIRIQDGIEMPVPLRNLKVGDEILVRNNELIPADSILKSGTASINYGFVTGESRHVSRKKGELIYAGGRQEGESICLKVEKEISQSYLLQLWNKEVFKKDNNAYLSSFVLDFSKYFTYGTILIAIGTFFAWLLIDPSKILFAVTSVLLVACPCALALSLPFALGNSLSKLSLRGLYLKNADAVEKIAEIDTIVFDKTGTLTQTDSSTIDFIGAPLNQNLLTYIKSATRQSMHPLSRIVYNEIKAESLHTEHFTEVPSKGIFCLVAGNQIELGSAFWVGLENENKVNESRVYFSFNGTVKGYFIIRNKYRDGLDKMFALLSNKYELHLLSGDQETEKSYLKKYFPIKTHLNFRQNPSDKLNYIEDLKAKGKKVLMLGDGLNDAGALKAADIGISVSEDVYNFSPACDGILEGGKLINLNSFLSFSKKSIVIIKLSLVLSLLYNLAGLFFAVQGLLTPLIAAILMPLSSVTIVLFVVITTNIAAKQGLKI
jgi:Cu+-exporting ATPase